MMFDAFPKRIGSEHLHGVYCCPWRPTYWLCEASNFLIWLIANS